MKKVKLGKNTLLISIISLLTIASWIGFEVYRIATKTTISPTVREQMSPLSPRINREVIDSLKETLVFTEDELNIAPTPTPIIETSQTTTESSILREEK